MVDEGAGKGQRTRRAILDAAISRFAELGHRGTTLAAVAADAGITPTALYRYFSDKDELFAAAVDADGEALVELARQAINRSGTDSFTELLGVLADGLAAAVEEHPLVARVLAGHDMLSPERILALPALAELRAELTELITFGLEAGLVRPGLDPATTALALETVVLDHVGHLVALGGAASGDDARWAAVVYLLDVVLRP